MPKCNSIKKVTKGGLCTGCGICVDVCTHKSIKISIKNGLNVPIVASNTCINCGACLKSCPGVGINIAQKSRDLFSGIEIKENYYIGRYIECYCGHSNEPEIRLQCASGGMVSQILIYLLENHIINGAIVTGFSLDAPMHPHTYIATNKDEILQGKSSKYCVVSFDGIISQINQMEGKYVIVGLPCHIHAFRKYESLHPKFKNKILGYLGLYCSATKSYKSQDYLLYRYHIKRQDFASFTYREDGCMGFMKFIDAHGNIKKRIEYLTYYIPLRGFFNAPRCSLCIDHYAELADVSFGDFHIGDYAKDKIGISSFITKSLFWDNIIREAKEKNSITATIITADLLNNSQEYVKKHKKGPGIVAAFKVRRWLGLAVPEYNIHFQIGLKGKFILREFTNMVCRFIGNSQKLWFIIRFLDKNRI